MRKGCLYWIFVGWWYEPIKLFFLLYSKILIYAIIIGCILMGFIYLFPVAVPFLILLGIVKLIVYKIRKYGNIDFDNMDGHRFEQFCADVLCDNGFYNVKVTKGSGDHGIDILANKGNMKYGIQCKCYADNVGNKAVQEVYSGKTIYNADIAVVLTNRYFTKQAKEEAKKLGVELWDRNKLLKLVNKPKKELFQKVKKDGLKNNDTLCDKKGEISKNKSSDVKVSNSNNRMSKEQLEEYMKLCKEEYGLERKLDFLRKQRDDYILVKNSNEEIRKVAIEIYKTFLIYGVEIKINDIVLDIGNVIYYFVPISSVRVKAILSYQPEISLALGSEVEIKLLSEKGCIGLFVPSDCIIRKRNEKESKKENQEEL